MSDLKKYEYGAMSSKYEVTAPNKLVAYCAMIFHFDSQSHLIAIYSPEECKQDSWMSFDGKISERLHEIFGGKPEDFGNEKDAFDDFVENNISEIKKSINTIKQLV